MKSLCVFCGSSFGTSPATKKLAQLLGQTLAIEGITLVYGGASVGLMGLLADAAMAKGGEVVGVMPEQLVAREVAHPSLNELIIVKNMHERKAKMAELSDGFIALPGGLGTLEELFEVLTWAQLGLHQKPCGLLNSEGYYDSLINFLDQAVAAEFIKPAHRNLLMVSDTPTQLLTMFGDYKAPNTQNKGPK